MLKLFYVKLIDQYFFYILQNCFLSYYKDFVKKKKQNIKKLNL